MWEKRKGWEGWGYVGGEGGRRGRDGVLWEGMKERGKLWEDEVEFSPA